MSQQVAIHASRAISSEIISQRMYLAKDPSKVIEKFLQEFVSDGQPALIRVDIVLRDGVTGRITGVASSIEEDFSIDAFTPHSQ